MYCVLHETPPNVPLNYTRWPTHTHKKNKSRWMCVLNVIMIVPDSFSNRHTWLLISVFCFFLIICRAMCVCRMFRGRRPFVVNCFLRPGFAVLTVSPLSSEQTVTKFFAGYSGAIWPDHIVKPEVIVRPQSVTSLLLPFNGTRGYDMVSHWTKYDPIWRQQIFLCFLWFSHKSSHRPGFS